MFGGATIIYLGIDGEMRGIFRPRGNAFPSPLFVTQFCNFTARAVSQNPPRRPYSASERTRSDTPRSRLKSSPRITVLGARHADASRVASVTDRRADRRAVTLQPVSARECERESRATKRVPFRPSPSPAPPPRPGSLITQDRCVHLRLPVVEA